MIHLIRSWTGVISVSLCLALAGCGGGGGGGGNSNDGGTSGQSDSTSPDLVISTFTASYYYEDDGTVEDVGNDGSDPDIIPVFMAEETSYYIGIHYSGDALAGIDAHNLYAEWEGTITLREAGTLDLNFDTSHAIANLSMDGVLSQEWLNNNRTSRVSLQAGDHQVRVYYHNHASTAQFNLSFTRYGTLDVATANATLAPLITDNTKIVYVGSTESDDLYNIQTITLPECADDILLVISSEHSVNIEINNDYNTAIAGVLINSTIPLTTVKGQGGAPVYHVTDLQIGTNDFTAVNQDITTMTGRAADATYGATTLSSVTIAPL